MLFSKQSGLLAVAFIALLIHNVGFLQITEAQAQQRLAQSATPKKPRRIRFDPPSPPDPGEPSDRGQGGGRRGDCENYESFTALVPTPQKTRPDQQWGLTTSDRPTVWFNAPKGIDAGLPVQWQLRNAQNKAVYKKALRLPATKPGVVSFSLPETAPALPAGTYRWELAIFCDPSLDVPVYREGKIQRINPPQALQQELAIAKTPVDRAVSYAKHGVWYDAIAALGTQIRSAQPNAEAMQAWNELLEQQNLSTPTTTTPTSCCTIQSVTPQLRSLFHLLPPRL
ncbi:MAG: DUF928 domain-containing protein [Myxacorys californica WJT36-NPBG1]|jgi:hypothetical protein|nr:DUF928 domain-containing protein [Myxacorys californica WJT36-NPBG1]